MRSALWRHLIELRPPVACGALLAMRGRASSSCLYFAQDRSSRFLVCSRCWLLGQGKLTLHRHLSEAFFVEVKVAFFAALMFSSPVDRDPECGASSHLGSTHGTKAYMLHGGNLLFPCGAS
jgi:sec-independent protein translocase protein TatC